MAHDPIFSLSCPSCGAKVPVYSATSALVVCEYCKSTLIRSGETAVDSGVKSALIEDFSPIQLYTSGTVHGKPFTVIGRIQIQYERGYWNEWYAIFADGTYGWLGDFSGEYTFTSLAAPSKGLPAFKDIKAASTSVKYAGKQFLASDVREAKSVKANAQGELPFTLDADEPVVAADFRCRDEFITLDYSQDKNQPLIYHGKAVQLKNLHCQNLRTDDQIIQTAGKLRGERTPFKCPNCGASLEWYAGIAENIICPNCHGDITLEQGKAKALKIHKMRKAQIQAAALNLGEIATINGKKWTVIGLVKIQETASLETQEYMNNKRQRVSPDGDSWTEYLLYCPGIGFQWLVESGGSWDLSHTMPVWPKLQGNGQPEKTKPMYDYGGIVAYAAGAFYWHIEPGDITFYRDFRADKNKICAEITRNELNWSLSRPVTGIELATWFKLPELEKAVRNKTMRNSNLHHKTIGTIALLIFFTMNLPAYIKGLSGEDSIIIMGIISFIAFQMIRAPFLNEDEDD